MGKFSKKFAAMVLALSLVVVMAACGGGEAAGNSGTSTAGNAAAGINEGATIAYLGSDTGNTDNVILGNSMAAVCELANVEMVYQPDETYDADSLLSFVENQISAGAKGLLFTIPSDSVLPTIMNLCEEAEVYWGISTRSINDDAIREKVEASPYYVGNCYEDEYDTGYQLMTRLNAFGYKKIAIISTAKGNPAVDAREEAFAVACEEYGMEIIAEARDFTQASDVMVASQSFLAAYDDLDCILIAGTYAVGATSAAVKAVEDAGRGDDVKVAAVDYGLTPNIVESFESGILTLNVIGMQYDPFCVGLKVINAVRGTPISDISFSTLLPLEYITDVETAKKWEETYSDATTQYMTADKLKQVLKMYNEDLDAEQFNQIVSTWNPVG